MKKKNCKKKYGMPEWVPVILVLVMFLALMGKLDNLKISFEQGNTIVNNYMDVLENPPDDYIDSSCTIKLDQYTYCIGEEGAMTLKDGKNSRCAIFFKYESNDWKYGDMLTTNDLGYAEYKATPSYTGVYLFRAICEKGEGNYCVTNEVEAVAVTCGGGGSGDETDDETDGPVYACNAAWPIPQSQSDCSMRVCSVGSCVYYPASLVAPARCGCEE